MKEHTYDALSADNKLIHNLKDIAHTMQRLYEGKGSQKQVLIVLDEFGPLTQKALTKRLGIQPGSASEVLAKVEAAGYIVRVPSQTDRRTTDVQLTSIGQIEARKARDKREQRHKQMFQCLTEEEKETLISLLQKINMAWDRQYREQDEVCIPGQEALKDGLERQ